MKFNTEEVKTIPPTHKVKLDLVGLDGNAFSIMGAFQKAARRQHWTPSEIKAVVTEMQSDDYNHLLATAMEFCEEGD
jgi:hypothetical protein